MLWLFSTVPAGLFALAPTMGRQSHASKTPNLGWNLQEQKVKLMATGLSLVLKSELLMTERDLEVNDIALALQVVPDGLQWSSTMSLTPEGERIIRMGLASGMSPRLKVNGASLLDASISFDVNTALAQVHDLDGLQRDEAQGRLRSRDLISEMRECGLVCVAHNVIRKPLAMMKFVRQHLSAKVPFIEPNSKIVCNRYMSFDLSLSSFSKLSTK